MISDRKPITQEPMFGNAEGVLRVTKAALATALTPEDLDFLDKAMRTYAANVVHEFLEDHRVKK